MRATFTLVVAMWLANAGAQTAAETMRFTITRNDEPIGTHTIDINRAETETSVNISTDLAVNVVFFTAYRFRQQESEHWLNGHLVALRSTSDNNGVRHKVVVAMKGSDLELDVDGKITGLEKDVVPASLWNPDFLRHSVVLDPQDGEVTSISVVDGGQQSLRFGRRTVEAYHYTVKGRHSQEVWYDDRGRLVRVKIIGSDGSVILFNPA